MAKTCEQYTTEDLYVLTLARRYAAMADERIAEIKAEINQLHEELRKIVQQWTFGAEQVARDASARTEQRYDEAQLRLRLLDEELTALEAIRARARRDAGLPYDDGEL